MEVTKIIYIVVVITFLIVNCIFSVKSSKKNKTTKTQDSCEKPTIMTILQRIPNYIIAAEELYNNLVNPAIKKTGTQKLQYVLDKVKVDCLTNGIEYNEDYIKEETEKLVELTKQVNSDKK